MIAITAWATVWALTGAASMGAAEIGDPFAAPDQGEVRRGAAPSARPVLPTLPVASMTAAERQEYSTASAQFQRGCRLIEEGDRMRRMPDAQSQLGGHPIDNSRTRRAGEERTAEGRKLVENAQAQVEALGQRIETRKRLLKEGHFYEWVDREGREIRAIFVKLENNNITLLRDDGREFTFPLDRLSADDRERAGRLIESSAGVIGGSETLPAIVDIRLARPSSKDMARLIEEGESLLAPFFYPRRNYPTSAAREAVQEFVQNHDFPLIASERLAHDLLDMSWGYLAVLEEVKRESESHGRHLSIPTLNAIVESFVRSAASMYDPQDVGLLVAAVHVMQTRSLSWEEFEEPLIKRDIAALETSLGVSLGGRNRMLGGPKHGLAQLSEESHAIIEWVRWEVLNERRSRGWGESFLNASGVKPVTEEARSVLIDSVGVLHRGTTELMIQLLHDEKDSGNVLALLSADPALPWERAARTAAILDNMPHDARKALADQMHELRSLR